MELPRLQPLYEKYRDRGLEIVAVEAFRMEDAAKKFIEENELTYHFVQDFEGDNAIVSTTYGVIGYPTTFIIDKTGMVMFFHLGFSAGDEDKIEQEILSLM